MAGTPDYSPQGPVEPDRRETGAGDVRPGPWGIRGLWRPILLAALLAGSLIGFRLLGVDSRLGDMVSWIRGLGYPGLAVFALVCVAWALAMIPATILQVLSGALFGPWLGTAVYTTAYTSGALLCFLIARHAARTPVKALLDLNPSVRKMMALADRHDFMVVALMRLMPLAPTNTINYALGVTGARFNVFAFWSFFGMIPMTFIVASGADVAVNGFDDDSDVVLAVSAGLTGLLLGVAIWAVRMRLAAQRRSAIKSSRRREEA